MLGLTQEGGQVPPARDRGLEGIETRASSSTPQTAAVGPELAPLIRTIESEIIPRLLLAHKGAAEARGEHDARGEIPSPEHVLEFAGLVLTQDASAAARYMEAMVDQGFLLETLYLELLAPAARHLGALWEQDLCDFVDVTVALGRVQHVIREFSPVFRDNALAPKAKVRRILLTPAPGEQHSMGLMMVKEFFLRGGWEVVGGPGVPVGEVGAQLAEQWFDCVGVSAGGDCRLEGLATWIASLRAVSRNRSVSIMLGGPCFIAHPELAALLGADATAADARTAVRQAEILAARPH
ncbi:cobalamin-dependent protein [Nevskia sp.]|uniref:cobalamin B12-binding domain-containing protein n=1 Tax=Nevskia sp. TaxID=1929292 RepID=UPI0025EC0ED4|nr:cobalamin-dependent protein [Nevskia sp.]